MASASPGCDVSAGAAGGVASYRNENASGVLTLPATSRQVPETDAFSASGPEKVAVVHELTPEVRSVPEKATLSGFTYQSLRSAGRSGAAVSDCGGVLSIFTTAVDWLSPSELWA